MPFSRKIKDEVLKRAHYHCCVCQKPSISIDVHHIIPQSDGGPDTTENAAPLCPTCHSDFGGNPEKRTAIIKRRDAWYELCEQRFSPADSAVTKEDLNRLEQTILNKLSDIERGTIPLDNPATLTSHGETAKPKEVTAPTLDSAFELAEQANPLFEQGRFDESLLLLERASKLEPTNPFIIDNIGVVLGALNRDAEALTYHERAIALEPRIATAHYNRGVVLGKLGNLDGALASFDQAIALDPNFGEAHANRGKVLVEQGKYPDGLAAYGNAIASGHNSPELHNNRGNVLGALGRFQECIEEYQLALELHPNYLKQG